MKDRQSINRNTPDRIADAGKAKVKFMTPELFKLAAAVVGMKPGLDFSQYCDGNLAFPYSKHLGRIDKILHTRGLPGDKPLLNFINEWTFRTSSASVERNTGHRCKTWFWYSVWLLEGPSYLSYRILANQIPVGIARSNHSVSSWWCSRHWFGNHHSSERSCRLCSKSGKLLYGLTSTKCLVNWLHNE